MTPHVFVRHPPLPQMQGTCYGRLDAMPDPRVFADAAAHLAPRLPDRALACSPRLRCRALADALQAERLARGLAMPPPKVDDRLRELDFGEWEGLRWDAIPRASLDAWAADVAGFAPPGGESFDRLVGRVRAALAVLDGPHVVITHAGVIRAAHRLAGWSAADAAALAVPYLEPIGIGAPDAR